MRAPNVVLSKLATVREAGIAVCIVILVIAVSLRAQAAFVSLENLRDIFLNSSILAIVALAQMMVILTRGIDLSVGSMIALVAMMVSVVVTQYTTLPPVLAVLLGMLLGSVLGSFNGLLIAVGNVPPIIATLGTLSIYRGAVFWYSGGDWINAYEYPESFKLLTKGTPLVVPNLVIYALLVAPLVAYLLRYTRLGRNMYATGGNPAAAQMVGIRIQRTRFRAYLLSGVMCGLAGALWASRFESAQTNTALGFELQSVAAAVVGGVSIFGGSGTVSGVLLGTLLLGLINNSLTLIKISPFWQLATQGLLILLTVVADSVILRRLERQRALVKARGGAVWQPE